MNHMVAKMNDDETWDIEVQTFYSGRPMVVRIPRGTIQIEALKSEGEPDWTFEVLDEMAVC